MPLRDVAADFNASMAMSEFETKAVDEHIKAAFELTKEILARPHDSHTDAEKNFLMAQAKLGIVGLMRKAGRS